MTTEPLRAAFATRAADLLLPDALDVVGTVPCEALPPALAVLDAFADRAAESTYEWPELQLFLTSAVEVMVHTGHALAQLCPWADRRTAVLAALAASAAYYRTALPTGPGLQWSVGAEMTVAMLRAVEASADLELDCVLPAAAPAPAPTTVSFAHALSLAPRVITA